MAAYLIANLRITDPEGFNRYREQVSPMIVRWGGRYLVRGGKVEVMEGDPGLHRLVILEFPSMERLREFYGSADYAPLLALRGASTVSDVAFVEGYAAPAG
jgi:uncharacterized protein (DUF1330 family)